MTSANPRLDRVDIGSASNLAGPAGRWIGTGITLPSDPLEEISIRITWSASDDYITGLFTVGRIIDELAPANAGGERSGGGGITSVELVRLGASAAGGYFLGHTANNELLILGPTAVANAAVEVWTFRAEDVRVEDLAPRAQQRVLPEPTPEEAHYRVEVNADGSGYELVRADGGRGIIAVYATVDQFRARTDAGESIDNDLLEEELDAAARLIDRELGVVSGHFAPTTEATYVFPCRGGSVLTLRDEDGLAYGLRSVVEGGIRPDYDVTGRYNQQAWDLDDAWIWPRARNAVQLGRPYHALELRRTQNAPLTIWPWTTGSVQITGAWGWEATPSPIRELTVKIARDQRDTLRGGAAARVEMIDDGVTYRPDTWRLWSEIKTRYGRRMSLAR